jgi:hypothetical protein
MYDLYRNHAEGSATYSVSARTSAGQGTMWNRCGHRHARFGAIQIALASPTMPAATGDTVALRASGNRTPGPQPRTES